MPADLEWWRRQAESLLTERERQAGYQVLVQEREGVVVLLARAPAGNIVVLGCSGCIGGAGAEVVPLEAVAVDVPAELRSRRLCARCGRLLAAEA